MTKGSKFLHVPNKYRTLSWLLTVAGRLAGGGRLKHQDSSDWGLEIVSHCHVAGEGGLITVSTHHHRRDWHQKIGNPLKGGGVLASRQP